MQRVPDSLLGGLVTTENRTSGVENTARGTEKQGKGKMQYPTGHKRIVYPCWKHQGKES